MATYVKLKGLGSRWLVEVTWADGSKQIVPVAVQQVANWKTHQYERDATVLLDQPGKLLAWREALLQSRKVVMVEFQDYDGQAWPNMMPNGWNDVWDIDDLKIDETGAMHSFGLIARHRKAA